MAGFKVELFKGMRPRISTLKLPFGEAANVENVDLGSGDIQPFYDNSTEQAVTSGRSSVTIHRFKNNGTPLWLEWDDYVDVALGPVKDDVLERTYYTGDSNGTGAPKMTNTDLVGSTAPYPAGWVYMGVPAPLIRPYGAGPGLPEDLDSETRLCEKLETQVISADTVNYTTYPGTGTEDRQWTYTSGTTGDAVFNIEKGTSFRVLSVLNSSKVTLESVSDEGVFAHTFNSDKTTVNDWDSWDNNGSTRVAEFLGYTIPTGAIATIPGHKLLVGDVITVTAKNGMAWGISASGSVYADERVASWPAIEVEYTNGAAVTVRKQAPFLANTGGTILHRISGYFYYSVDRTASTISELEDRQYVYTYVTDLGEEGPPSPVSLTISVLDTTVVSLGGFATPPTVGYNITLIRLYRTNSTEAGTEYQFVKEFAVAPTTTDAVASADLGEVISTTTWDPPPIGLSGLTELPNGMLVGFDGKNVHFCEPYYPHAWPAEYDQAIGHDIVGLAAFGNSLAIMTKGNPYVASGSHPRNMNIRPIKFNQSCLNKESIATDLDRVYYASPDGIVEISVNGIRLATEGVLTKENWATYSPSTMRSSFHEGRYYGFYDFDISAIDPVISAELSGSATSALENDIVNGGTELIITLANDIWVTAGTSFNAQRQNIIDGITAAAPVQTLGWNNILRDQDLVVANVVRTSDTVVTITLPASSSYSVATDEVITCTVPAAALGVSNAAVICGSTFTITSQDPAATVLIGGTLSGATEANVVSGGYTITLTLVNDTWTDALTFAGLRQDIIDGLLATQTEALGFNAQVPQLIPVSGVVRTSDTLVTITLPAVPLYDIIANESLSATIPADALFTSIVDVVASNSIVILSSAANPYAVLSGTILGALEASIVSGGKTIIITLTNDTWIATGSGPIGTTVQSQALLDALIATSDQTLGFNAVVVPGITVATELVRTSSTVATITLSAESTYSIATNETVGITIPASVLTSAVALTASNTFGILAQAPVTCSVTGTATESLAENDVVDGGKTIILTLKNDTWLATGTGPIGSTANTNSLIAGITSAQAEAAGWNAEVRANMVAGDVARTSDTVCTITLAAEAAYDITAEETITITVPSAVLTDTASAAIAAPTFTVAVDVPASVALTGTITTAAADTIRDTGATIILTIADDTWVASGATFNAQRAGIIAGLTSATSQTFGWNATVRDVLAKTAVVRTSNTVVTITIPATPTYTVPAGAETITVTVPAAAIEVSTAAVVASPTFALDETIGTKVMAAVPVYTVSPTRGVAFAYTSNSFTDWSEDIVDADIASTTTFINPAIAYDTSRSRWVIASRFTSRYHATQFFSSDDDGGTWTLRTQINSDQSPSAGGFFEDMHYNVSRDVMLASRDTYNYLMYSTDGATWSESLTPWATLTAQGAYNPYRFFYGGANVVYGQGSKYHNGTAWEYYGAKSGDLTTPAGAWSEFQLVFDGAVNYSSIPYTNSANGKIIYVLSEYIPPSGNYNLYISTVTHGGSTETYVGKKSGTYAGRFSLSAASDTKIVFLNTSGSLLTCDVGSEGTIGNWTTGATSATATVIAASVSWHDLIYDPGTAGKTGLGFIAVGTQSGTGKGVVYTSITGAAGSWTLRYTSSASTYPLLKLAANTPPDVT